MVRYKFTKMEGTIEREVSVKVTSSNLYEVLDFIGKTGVLSGLDEILKTSDKTVDVPKNGKLEDYVVIDLVVGTKPTMVSLVLTAKNVQQMYDTTFEKAVNTLNYFCEWIHNRFEGDFDTSDLTILELCDVLSTCFLFIGEEDCDEITDVASRMYRYRDDNEDILVLEEFVERARKNILD